MGWVVLASAAVAWAVAAASGEATTTRGGSADGHSACALVSRAAVATAVGVPVDAGSPFPPSFLFSILRTPNAPRPDAWSTCRWGGEDSPWFLSLSVGIWSSAADASKATTLYRRFNPQFVRRCRAVASIKATTCFTPILQKLIGGKTEVIGTELIATRSRVALSLWLSNGSVTHAINGHPFAERPAELIPMAKLVLARVRPG